MDKQEVYYLVIPNPTQHTVHTKQYATYRTYDEAWDHAENMATINPGIRYDILTAVAGLMAEPKPVRSIIFVPKSDA